jgi:hypothetical protein
MNFRIIATITFLVLLSCITSCIERLTQNPTSVPISTSTIHVTTNTTLPTPSSIVPTIVASTTPNSSSPATIEVSPKKTSPAISTLTSMATPPIIPTPIPVPIVTSWTIYQHPCGATIDHPTDWIVEEWEAGGGERAVRFYPPFPNAKFSAFSVVFVCFERVSEIDTVEDLYQSIQNSGWGDEILWSEMIRSKNDIEGGFFYQHRMVGEPSTPYVDAYEAGSLQSAALRVVYYYNSPDVDISLSAGHLGTEFFNIVYQMDFEEAVSTRYAFLRQMGESIQFNQ